MLITCKFNDIVINMLEITFTSYIFFKKLVIIKKRVFLKRQKE